MIRPQIADVTGGILFLGDAPNDEADIKGRPFVGSDGHLLSRALRLANMTDPSAVPDYFEPGLRGETRRLLWERRAHSFAYVLPEPLPRNADMKTAIARTTDADLVNLGELIAVTLPNVIVTLGDLALWSVTGETSSEQWRGAPRKATRFEALAEKVFPTYPLDRVQAQYKMFGPLVADLMKVRNEAQFPEVRSTEVALWLEPDLGDLAVFKSEHIDRSDLLTLDIETAVDQIVCVQIATDRRTAIVLPFVDYRQPSRSYWAQADDEIRAWQWLAEVLDTPIPKLGQNFTAYDAQWLLSKMGIGVRNLRHDTRLMHHILQPELPKSLAFMGSMYTQMPRWKSGVEHGFKHNTEGKRDA